MNLFGVMDISASALEAERVRAEVVAANMANAETTKSENGGPYQRQRVVFQQAGDDGFAASLLGREAMGSGFGRMATRSFSSAVGSEVVSGAAMGGMMHSAVFGMGPVGSGGGFAEPDAPAVDGGVEVAEVVSDPTVPIQRFDPNHPDADANGYVAYPDINPLTEMVDLMGATRSYGLNATAVQAEKSMVTSSLEILK